MCTEEYIVIEFSCDSFSQKVFLRAHKMNGKNSCHNWLTKEYQIFKPSNLKKILWKYKTTSQIDVKVYRAFYIPINHFSIKKN